MAANGGRFAAGAWVGLAHATMPARRADPAGPEDSVAA
jgi:hypothetical protein